MIKTKTLHPRNPHNSVYDFEALCKSEASLTPFVHKNKYDNLSIDFSNPSAVLALNKALLSHFYNIKNWSIPKGYLCPPIPGRADYLHYITDVLYQSNGGQKPKDIYALDIGTGANLIYPIVGVSVYDYHFVGSDIDPISIASAQKTIANNPLLKEKVTCRLQQRPDAIFTGLIQKNETFDFTMCNPPFHASAEEANAGSLRKVRNLSRDKNKKKTLNFGGKANELWCEGGESAFIKKMIEQSKIAEKKVFWFSTLVSKKENLTNIYKTLKRANAIQVQTIEMQQGQKITRIVVWTFLTKKEQKEWRECRWQ